MFTNLVALSFRGTLFKGFIIILVDIALAWTILLKRNSHVKSNYHKLTLIYYCSIGVLVVLDFNGNLEATGYIQIAQKVEGLEAKSYIFFFFVLASHNFKSLQ